MKARLPTSLFVFAVVALAFSSAVSAQPQQHEFDGILDSFRVQAGMWQGSLTLAARWMFFTLATMQFCYTNITLALKGGDISDFISQNTRFVLGTGIMYVFLVHSFDWSNALIKGFLQAGERAVMVSAPGAFQSIDPAGIFQNGLVVAGSLFAQMGIWSGAGNVSLVFCALVMIICFAFLAALMAVVIVESYIITGGAVLLLGFGGSSWTGDIARKAMMYAVSVGAKLFVMQLIVGVAMGSILDWTQAYESKDSTSTLSLIGIIILITVMAKMIPELIQGILSGVSVGGSSAMMSTMAAGLATAAAGTAALATGGASVAGTSAASAGSAAAGGATSGAQGAAMFGGQAGAGGVLGATSGGVGVGGGSAATAGSAPLGPLGAMGRTAGGASGSASSGGAGSGAAGASSAPVPTATPSTSGGGTGSDKADGFNPQAAGVSGGKKSDSSGGGATSGGAGEGGSGGGGVDQPSSSSATAQSSDADSEPGAALSEGKSVADNLDAAPDTSIASPPGGEASTLDERASSGSAGHLAKMAGHMVDMGSGFNPNAAVSPIAEIGKGADEEEPAPMGNSSVDASSAGNLITGAGSPAPSNIQESSTGDYAKRGAVAGFAIAGPGGAAIGAAAGALLTPQINATSQRAKAALQAAKSRFGIEQGTDK